MASGPSPCDGKESFCSEIIGKEKQKAPDNSSLLERAVHNFDSTQVEAQSVTPHHMYSAHDSEILEVSDTDSSSSFTVDEEAEQLMEPEHHDGKRMQNKGLCL